MTPKTKDRRPKTALPIRQTEADVSTAAAAVATFLDALRTKGLTVTVFGVPIRVEIGK